ncbi:MAG: O-antigen ligase family protein [Planctomycetia bacterium]|nr:O-antigen ligase family protein [Planctomycetia bacterium]
MSTLTAQKSPIPAALLLTVIAAAVVGLISYQLMPAYALLITWITLGALAFFVFYTIEGDLLTAILVWMVTLIVFHEEFWRMTVPFFFALTIPRLGIVVLVALLIGMFMAGRLRLRHAWPASGYIAAVAVYFFLSAMISGFETRSVVSVHYRLIGGYLFPFAVFGLVLHAFHSERDFKRLAVFFSIICVYLTFTGWCERFGISALIWPRFINDPSVGIHWGRVRGPFVMSAAMGLALVYCYFNNLVLARNVERGRWLLYALNALMLPVIFWTKTRSVWLSFVLCLGIWAAYSRRRTSRAVSVSLLVAAALIIAVVNMENFLSDDRAKGGLTDTEPLLLRIGLAQMTWEIVQEHPLIGVGFGHFRDHAPAFARDPSSPFYAFGTTALEHNNLLSIVAETGVIGLVLYSIMMIVIVRFSIQLFRKLPPKGPGFISRDLLVLYWILVMAYFIDGTFRETSDNPFANSLFFGLSAIPVALNILLGPVSIYARPGFPTPLRGGVRSGPPRPIGRSGPGAAPDRALRQGRTGQRGG